MLRVDRDVVVPTNDVEFMVAALRHAPGVRMDGRGPMDMRAVHVAFPRGTYEYGPAGAGGGGGSSPASSSSAVMDALRVAASAARSGTVEVVLGQTRVVASVSGDIVAPFPDRPTEGFLQFYVDFSPMASPFFESNRPSARSVEISRLIERGVRDSRALDTEALCIVAGEKVWALRCDIHIVDHGGNMIDCANLAAVTALLHFRRPDVTIIGDSITVHRISDRQPVPLSMHHVPLCITFAMFDGGRLFVVDPSLKEELICESLMTVTMNSHRELCCVQKSGGAPISSDLMMRCLHIAAAKVAELTDIVHQRVREDSVPPKKSALPVFKPIEAFGVNITKSSHAIGVGLDAISTREETVAVVESNEDES